MVQGLPVCQAVGAAVDAAGDGYKVASVGKGVEAPAVPVPRGAQGGQVGALQQCWDGFKVGHVGHKLRQAVARGAVVGAACGLDQAPAQVALAVAGLGVAQVGRPS